MSPTRTPSRTRLGAAAGLLGVAVALTSVTGAGPVPSIFQLTGAAEDVSGPCDELEHAADPACAGTLSARRVDDDSSSTTSSIVEDSTTSTAGQPALSPTEVRTVGAGDAGSITVAVEGSTLRLLASSPNAGWVVEVERASGHEVEVTFRSGSLRVDVNVELEDGMVRERVRTRDERTDAETRVENGVTVREEAPDLDDDSDDHDSDDDSSGHGSDDDVDDDDSSGHGSDDGSDHD